MDINPRSPGILTCLIILSIEVSVGIITNNFITFVILRDFHKNKTMKPSNKIRVALNKSNVCFTIMSSTDLFGNILWPELFQTLFSRDIYTLLTMYSLCSCAWLAALVGFFYFAKVVDVKSGFHAWVKMKINYFVTYIIVVVDMSSLGISFLNMLLFSIPQNLSTNSSFIPLANINIGIRKVNLIVEKIILVLICMPFLALIMTTLSTVQFLKLHSHNMKKNMITSGEVTQKMYKSIVCRMLRFLFLYAVFYLVMFLYYFSVFPQQSPAYWVNLILIFSFIPMQSIIHIFDNPTLKNSLIDMYVYIICSKQLNAHKN